MVRLTDHHNMTIAYDHFPGASGHPPCEDPESFVRGGPTLTAFFFQFDEGRMDPNTTIRGPSMACQRNTI